jgi:hypothetical protein
MRFMQNIISSINLETLEDILIEILGSKINSPKAHKQYFPHVKGPLKIAKTNLLNLNPF